MAQIGFENARIFQKIELGSLGLEKGLKKSLSGAKNGAEKGGLEGCTSMHHLPM